MSPSKHIVIIDNYDSFTFNLYQIFKEHPKCQIEVIAHDKVVVEELDKFDKIVLSPGPDIPSAYPVLAQILDRYKGIKPILGVCLGHQAIAEYFGAKLYNLSKVCHGQKKAIDICDDNELLFSGLVQPVKVGLYHSWAVSLEDFPEQLQITATSESGVIMAISHRGYNIKGIQFHPESYMSQQGVRILHNWINQN
ncbi:anthranilate synthase component II [Myroides sp. LJL119]